MAVVIIGTLDTKAEELGFARDIIDSQGVDVHIVHPLRKNESFSKNPISRSASEIRSGMSGGRPRVRRGPRGPNPLVS